MHEVKIESPQKKDHISLCKIYHCNLRKTLTQAKLKRMKFVLDQSHVFKRIFEYPT